MKSPRADEIGGLFDVVRDEAHGQRSGLGVIYGVFRVVVSIARLAYSPYIYDMAGVRF